MMMSDVDRYLAIRRAAGFSYASGEWLLRSFVRFTKARGQSHVSAANAIEWAEASTSQNTRARRLSVIRVFSRFLRAEDPRHEIPPQRVFAPPQRSQLPYIFSSEELALLVEHAGRLGPAGSLRPHTFATLFGLLATTGMRVGEALALQLDDLAVDHLAIREAKFHKSRLVPLHPTTVEALEAYLARRGRVSDPHLFVSLRHRRLSYGATFDAFHQACRSASLPHQPGSWRLRMHDLRHTMAVRSLEAMPEERDRATQHTLALTTYMGHARVASTYWYLQNTPVLMRDVARRCERLALEGAAQ